MKILVLNCGSSSVKYKLIDTADNRVMAEGGVERIGLDDGMLKFKLPDGTKKTEMLGTVDHKGAIQAILNNLISPEYGCISSFDEINAVGHRVVHGGEKFNASVLINDEVKEMIRECYDIAPLHNPANMTGIDAITALMPSVPQVAVFDTAFHQTMPKKAYMYAIPYELYEKYAIRRYGFHGTSHRYVSKRVCDYLGVKPEDKKVITCHIGNGGSVAAVDCGKCVDTSMGLTPLEGVMMGTRSGDIDGGAVSFIQKKLGLDADGISNLLNKKSGVLGITGISSDMREIDAASDNGDEKARLALEMYNYRIKKYVGAYAAAMGGADIIVFTAGVGENQANMRESVCENMEWMGVKLDVEKNNAIHGEEAVISAPDSKVTVVVIPTDEELMIASDTMELCGK